MALAAERPTISPVGLRVVGPSELLAGAQAAVRVVLTDHRAGAPVSGGAVALTLAKVIISLTKR